MLVVGQALCQALEIQRWARHSPCPQTLVGNNTAVMDGVYQTLGKEQRRRRPEEVTTELDPEGGDGVHQEEKKGKASKQREQHGQKQEVGREGGSSDKGKWLGVVRAYKADVLGIRRRDGQSGRRSGEAD